MTSCCRISTSAAANAASMSSGAASATATASGGWTVARLQERDLTDGALGLGVVGLGVEDRLVGRERRVEVAVVEMLTRLLEFRVDLLGLAFGAAVELARGRARAASRPSGAAARAAARPGSSTAADRPRARRRSARPARRTSARPAAMVSTLTVASAHLPPSASARPARSCRPVATLDSLRGDQSSTTTGTSLDRTSTSASMLASVTSTPPDAAAAGAAPSRRGRWLLESRQVDRAGQAPADGRSWTRHAVKSVTSRSDADGAGVATAPGAPSRPVRSAHMRKITLPSGTMLASNASNHVDTRST